jgi:hypothetical protein
VKYPCAAIFAGEGDKDAIYAGVSSPQPHRS